MMFAIITPALITGAFTNRVTFKAYLLFLDRVADVRLLSVCAHGVEPDGVLSKWGVKDFAGGIVVHASPALRRWHR